MGPNIFYFISSPPPFPFPSYLPLLDPKTTCPCVLGWGGYGTVDRGSCAEYALLFFPAYPPQLFFRWYWKGNYSPHIFLVGILKNNTFWVVNLHLIFRWEPSACLYFYPRALREERGSTDGLFLLLLLLLLLLLFLHTSKFVSSH